MKKIVFLSREGVFAGITSTIMAELVDSLANVLTSNYEVSIICPLTKLSLAKKLAMLQGKNNLTKTKFSKVTYYFPPADNWEEAYRIIETINPDILHILADADEVQKLISRPRRVVFTFSNPSDLIDKEDSLLMYDAISCTSQAALDEIFEKDDKISKILLEKKTICTPCGLLVELFSPSRGLLMPKTYNMANQTGKEICRQKLARTYNIPLQSTIYLAASLRQDIDIENIIRTIPAIKEANGYLLIAAKITEKNKKLLKEYEGLGNFKYLGDSLNLVQTPTLVSGADFTIIPSIPTLGNFIALISAHYGSIPILSLNNYNLTEDFNKNNSIIVIEEDFNEAISNAAALVNNKDLFLEKRTAAMEIDKDWQKKKINYIKMYEDTI